MTKKNTGNNQLLKQLNRTTVLNLIRENRTISKSQLASITGLSVTALAVITSYLIEQGYICERSSKESSGGRRPIMLELKPNSFYSIGIDFDIDLINFLLMDITGSVVFDKQYNISNWDSPKVVIEKTEEIVSTILSNLSIKKSHVLGIGFSIPGMVDPKTCEIIMAPNLRWKNVQIKELMKKFTDIPVYVENDSMASAIGENWLGSCQGIKDFVCINIKFGIGSGIFLQGKPYRGATGCAGEVGHIVVDENGPKCGCGNYGCLETMVSSAYVAEKARKLVRQGVSSILNQIEDVDSINMTHIIDMARSGDVTCINILRESARYLGLGIANIVNTLNPSKIIFGSEFIKYADLVLDQIINVVHHKALKVSTVGLEIITSPMGEKASTYGAATLALKSFFGK